MPSIVIPAYNEEKSIERCLRTLLEGAQPGEFEIAVVCNGCVDATAERARRFSDRVKVIETPIPSKINALNLGDAHVSRFPRFYIDADVQIDAAAVRDVAKLLGEDSPVLVAAPRAIVAYEDRPWLVRSFFKAWTALPYFQENMIGSGVYAFSRAGRARFDRFPDVIADDEYARLVVGPDERRASPNSTFTIYPPRTLSGLVKIHTRARAGSLQLRERFPELINNNNTDPGRTLRILATTPKLWPHAPIYLGVQFLAKYKAKEKLRQRREAEWERDDTSRHNG
jgi:glycosyltransferase involved in cell wall biosynthesis